MFFTNNRARRFYAFGATEEGVFRQHLIADSGRRRDMIYFAILEDEWRVVKVGLEERLRHSITGVLGTQTVRARSDSNTRPTD
jgi:hypothetical protein